MTLVQDLEGDDFATRSAYEDGTLSVKLVGSLDMETTPRLRHFLGRVEEAAANTAQAVVFDATQLYLMSSSAISCFASFLKRLKGLNHPFRLTFRTNRALAWQRRAFEPLARLAGAFVTIESVPPISRGG
jgi:anti-anti-sigma factor